MSNSLGGNEQTLVEFATAIGGQHIEVTDPGTVHFVLGPCRTLAYAKDGGSRIRGTIFLGESTDSGEAKRWIARQPQPQSGVLESCGLPDGTDSDMLRILFERPFTAGIHERDPLLADAEDYGVAWHDRSDVGELVDASRFVVPGDPRDAVPANGWLLMGSDAVFPTESELRDEAPRGNVGVFEYTWTTAKQTEPGDLALIYFMAPRKAVQFVTRAASRAFFHRTSEVVADGKVGREQWWAYFTPPIEIEPIPLATLRNLAHGHLPLRGRSGHYLRPDIIEHLLVRAKHPEHQASLDRVLATPVGRADLPQPEDITMDDWPTLASGAMRLEAHVSEYVVEPLLRFALQDTDLHWRREYPVGRKWADYVVLDGNRPHSVVEVKLTVRESPDGVWANSKDFAQMRGYADALGCSGMLIDAARVLLVAKGGSEPYRVIERRNATANDLEAIRRHLTWSLGVAGCLTPDELHLAPGRRGLLDGQLDRVPAGIATSD